MCFNSAIRYKTMPIPSTLIGNIIKRFPILRIGHLCPGSFYTEKNDIQVKIGAVLSQLSSVENDILLPTAYLCS